MEDDAKIHAEYRGVTLNLGQGTYTRFAKPVANLHRYYVWSGLVMSLAALIFLVSFLLYWINHSILVVEEIFMFAPGLILAVLFLILYVPLYKYDPNDVAAHAYYGRYEILMRNAAGTSCLCDLTNC